MTRAEKYAEIFGVPSTRGCITRFCKDCPINGSGGCSHSKSDSWWNSEYTPTKPDDAPKITITFSNTSKESICDELIGFITTAFSPNNSIQYAFGISDCLKMIEDFKKESSKE